MCPPALKKYNRPLLPRHKHPQLTLENHTPGGLPPVDANKPASGRGKSHLSQKNTKKPISNPAVVIRRPEAFVQRRGLSFRQSNAWHQFLYCIRVCVSLSTDLTITIKKKAVARAHTHTHTQPSASLTPAANRPRNH